MDCPTCGRDLETKAGVRQHHTKVHDEPLPNRTCSDCRIAFYDPKSQLEFCEKCNSNAGSNNGNWSEAMERACCENCGDQFAYYPSEKDGVYCRDCVEESDGLLPENPMEPIERVSVDCPACGAEQQVLQSLVERRTRGVFCDLECYGNWLSENIVGPDHHSWTDVDPTYAHGWSNVRRAARVRDDYECQVCGKSKREIGRNPDVHHIQPVRTFEDPADAHTLGNVVSLCPSCHRKAESGVISVDAPQEK